MNVPYMDLKSQYLLLREEVLAAIDGLSKKAEFILGDEVEHFERDFAAYCGVKHCVALNSGTSALHLALLGCGIRPGDEVITSPNTFIATAEAISYTGANPSLWTSILIPPTSILPKSKRPSPRKRARSCPCIFTD